MTSYGAATATVATLPGDTAFTSRTTPPPGVTLSSMPYHNHQPEDDYSPVPGTEQSSYSSPGSASDHMGHLPPGAAKPLLPGSSALVSFDSTTRSTTSHVNRVITTTLQQKGGTGNNHSSTSVITAAVPAIVPSASVTYSASLLPNPTTSSGGAFAGGLHEDDDEEDDGGEGSGRRQKRLQRNRESARLSRRRRKQYLEILEERVNKMSHDLDQSRRAHIAEAVPTIRQKRTQTLLAAATAAVSPGSNATAGAIVPVLEDQLARTSPEMMVTMTFQTQQLKSLALEPSVQFVLWLTLQNDKYFRGGRAASERLSAARIGERVRVLCVVLCLYIFIFSLRSHVSNSH
jgi:bZIP transcription factor